MTAEQLAAAEADGENVLVFGGPGTGKTAVIAGRFAALVARGVAPERILALTFSRSATELRARITAVAPRDAQIEARTAGGFASRLIEADGPRFRSRRLLDPFAQQLVLESALESNRPNAYSAEVWNSRRFLREAGRLLADLERALPSALAEVREHATPRIRDLLALDARVRALREVLRANDASGLVLRALALLEDERSPQSRWFAGRYDHVLIDDVHEVDPVRFEVLAALSRSGARLFAAGDRDQALHRSSGARDGLFEVARKRFAMRVFTLSASQRCPQPICDLASKTPLLGAAPMTSAAPAHGARPDVARARTTADEAALVADRIEQALERGTPPERIAVLLRTPEPFSWALASELRGRGIPYVAHARDALRADPLVEVVRAALELFRAPLEIERWHHLLSTQTFGFDPIALRLALRELPPGGFASSLAAFAAAPVAPGRIPWSTISQALGDAAARWVAGDLGACARTLVRELGLLASIVDGNANSPLAGRADVARLHGFLDALAAAQRVLAQLGRPALPGDVVARLAENLDLLAQERAPERAAPGVRILGVQAAMGLEFDDVVIADAVDGRFPQDDRTCILLDASERAIFEAAGVESSLFGGERGRIEEAVHWYVAVTRARERLSITYASEDIDGTSRRPSRFIPPELALDGAAPVYRRTLERIETAALSDAPLRAALAGSERVRSAPLLAEYLAHGEEIFHEVAPRPIVSDKSIDVSSVAEWYKCRRRYYYGRLLRLPTEGATAATLGLLMHALLKTFHERVRDFTHVVPEDRARFAQELGALLDDRFDEAAFETRAEAAAARAFLSRAFARYAEALYDEALARPFVVEACEERVLITLGAGVLSGRIDRIDHTPAGVRILRDYKSGRLAYRFADELKKMAKARAAGAQTYAGEADGLNPQLALYRAGLDDVGHLDYVYFKGEGEDRDIVVSDTTDVAAVESQLDLLIEDVRENLVDALLAGTLTTFPETEREQGCRYCAHANLCDGPGVRT